MFKKLFNYINNHAFAIILAAVAIGCITIIYNLIDVTRKPPEIVITKGGVQNHLVWAANGACYFVRPYNNETVYLIPVEDCNKK